MAKRSGRDALALQRYVVMAYKAEGATEHRPMMITRIGSDDPRDTRKDDTVHFVWVEPDGSLGHSGYIQSYAIDSLFASGDLRFIDDARVDTRVKLPPDWQARNEKLSQLADEARRVAAERRRDDDREPLEHPSFGTITLTRASGSGRLFGSPFEHQHSVRIRVGRATKYRSLSNDRAHSHGVGVVEIAMSEAQFARFITSTSVGEGTPCTLTEVAGYVMPEPPAERETEKFHEDAQRALARAAKDIREAIEKAEALLDKPTVSKADRKEIVSLLSFALRAHEEHLPFTIKQFGERMEKIVSEGKHEIEAFLQQTLLNAGLEAASGGPIKLLPDGQTEK